MNRQDRNELKELLFNRIQERIKQIRSTPLEVTARDLSQYANDLGVPFYWEEYADASNTLKAAQDRFNIVQEDLRQAIPKENRPRYASDVENIIQRGAKTAVENRYAQTPEGQKIQQLKKEQSNLGASLLMISLPDEVKDLINRIDMLLGENNVLD